MPQPFRVPDDLAAHGLEFLPDGLVAAVGEDAIVRFMNSHAERITGLCTADVVGRDIREALPFQDADGASWWDVTNPWEGLVTRTGHRERLLMLPSGREVLVTAKYVRGGAGEPVRAVVLGLRDAEGRRRAEAESAALLTTVAHELRSPLTGVKGFSSTLLRNWDRFTDDQKRLMLETIEADADRVTRLITELLDASRINVGRLTVHAQPLDLRPRLEAQVERRVAAGADRGAVRRRRARRPPAAVGRPRPPRAGRRQPRRERRAARAGHGAPRRGASVLGDRPAVDLLVADDGEGIATQHRELVFSRFWQGGAKHGTGLGLYLVRGLVEAHGGVIRVEDAPGGGAQMRATFPDGED